MGAPDRDLKPRIEQFEGINNRTKETSLGANVLREGVDMFLDAAKKPVSRAGYGPPVVATTLGHSLWSHDSLPFALFADGEDLRALREDETALTVYTGLSPGHPLSYALINSAAYWSNGAQRGQVMGDLDARDWCCPNPSGQPLVAAIGTGAIFAGDTKVAVTFVDDLGRESGSTLAVDTALTAPGGLSLTSIPQPSDPAVIRVRVYVACNGNPTLYLYATLSVGVTSLEVTGIPEGKALETQFLEPMPAGTIVREFHGRLLVVAGRRVLFSPALRYGLYNRASDWVAVPGAIDMCEPVASGDASGLYVASGEKVYWLGGRTPSAWSIVAKLHYGVVPGSALQMPGSVWGLESTENVPVWLGRNGVHYVGMPGGVITPINLQAHVAPVGERAAPLFREADGVYQYILAQSAPQKPRMAVSDTAIARTYRYQDDGSYILEGEPLPDPDA